MMAYYACPSDQLPVHVLSSILFLLCIHCHQYFEEIVFMPYHTATFFQNYIACLNLMLTYLFCY